MDTVVDQDTSVISSSGGDSRLVFERLCSKRNLDALTSKEAWKLLERFYTLNVPTPECEFVWPVCAIYLVSTNSVLEKTELVQSGVHLSQLLRDCNMRLYDFFPYLQTFVGYISEKLRDKVVERLKLKFIVVSLAFEKYLDLFSKLFVGIGVEGIKHKRKAAVEKIFKFGWCMFVLAKGKLLSNSGDYVRSLQLMLCCVNFLLVHMPEGFRKRPIKVYLHQDEKSQDTMYFLCQSNCANYKQVKDMQDRIFNAWVESLCANSKIKYQPAKVPPDPLLSNAYYLGGLLDSFLNENEKELSREYDEYLLNEDCGFDERLFIENNEELQSPMRPPRKSVSNVLDANDWIKNNFSNVEDGFSESFLSKTLSALSNKEELIEKISSYVTNLISLVDFQAENEMRKSLASKLYYRAVEAIILSECTRIKSFDCSLLLSQESFNKSLLAGCLEIVMCAYQSPMMFPWILQNFHISPFDFYPIIECVLTHIKPSVPYMIRKHLIRVEERILEELAWETNSPIFTGLSEHQRQLLRDRLETTGTPKQIYQNACQIFSSPFKVDGNAIRIHRKLEHFIRKVAHLAYLRIKEFVRELNNTLEVSKIRQSVIQQVEYTFMYILINTSLLRDRNMDQLIMCIIYGVCKLNHVAISFNQIIDAYKCQPHRSNQVFTVVRLRSSTEYGGIIKFYNTIFLEEIEPFLRQLDTPEGENANQFPSSVNLRICSELRLQKSPQMIHNMHVSPRMTPLLFREHRNSIVLGSLKSPQSEFNRINSYINDRTTCANKAKRKLDYGTSESTETTNAWTCPLPQHPRSFVIPPITEKEEEIEELEDEDEEVSSQSTPNRKRKNLLGASGSHTNSEDPKTVKKRTR